MQFKYNLTVLSTLMLLFVTQACHAQLMCYVCDDCAKITDNTPLLQCDADYFMPSDTTQPSTMTTTDDPTTQSTEDEEVTMTTTPMEESSTTDSTTSSTTSSSTMETTIDDITTEPPVPTPPTVGPVPTTTPLPTPPNPGTVVIPLEAVLVEKNDDEEVDGVEIDLRAQSTTKSYVPSSELRVRQLRSVIDTDVTYHCYSVQKNDNGTMTTSRGCARVTAQEGVCSELELANIGTNLTKCSPCTNSRCNGSSAIGISAMAIFVAALAAILHRN